jgi:hypothetical protein
MLTEKLYVGLQSPLCVTKMMFHEPSYEERASAPVASSRVAQPNSIASKCLFMMKPPLASFVSNKDGLGTGY